MRPLLVMSLVIIAGFAAGCAGTPSSPPPPATAPTTYISSTGAPVAQVSATNAAGDLDAKRLVDAKKAGFTVINKDGEPLFCRTEPVLGSRIEKQTTCMTAKQMDDIHAQTQQGMQQYMRTNAPVSGK